VKFCGWFGGKLQGVFGNASEQHLGIGCGIPPGAADGSA
jgi:hypothetical protein